MQRQTTLLAGSILLAALVTTIQANVIIETVPVGNPGNAADMRYNLDQRPEGYGAVDYAYNIGKYEVTAGQYCAFLNAVADADAYGLYDERMDIDSGLPNCLAGCNIKRTGTSGNYEYSVSGNWKNRPVNFVDWGDAVRFANWLHNGQPSGAQDENTTEDGSYHLNGATSDEALIAITRESHATWVISTEDEWFKAAYHKNDGITGNYFDYPTGSDSEPNSALVDPVDPGNNATFDLGHTVGSPFYRTEVGAHENSDSPYGTFDQGGNVWEWNESPLGSHRGLRGGGFNSPGGSHAYEALSASNWYNSVLPSHKIQTVGFRVARVPEPATITLLLCGLASLLCRRRRK